MTRISILELEKLRKDVTVGKNSETILKKLFIIGEENLTENGVELLGKIKMLRGLSDEEISEYTGVPIYKIRDILCGRQRITKIMSEKLAKLGFKASLFEE